MESGYSKRLTGIVLFLLFGLSTAFAQYFVKATPLTHEVKDLSQRSSKVFDQNGERCALIKFETPVPALFSFNLGAQQIEKRENKDDEVWIWVSADVKKMTIRCTDCAPLKDYRVALKSGNVYRAKITTGLPQEVATTQNVILYCEHTPFSVSIDGSEPIVASGNTYYTELPIGEHEISVAAKFYKTYTGPIRVYRSRPYSDTIQLTDNYGELQLNVSQAGYTLLIDGETQKAATNQLIKLEPGIHKIEIEKARYQKFETTVEVRLKERTPVQAVLKPAFSQFVITTADEETEIWIDGQFKALARANLEIEWGTHIIEGRRQGYDTWEYPMRDFNANSEKRIKIPKLNKQYGAVRLSVFPPEAMGFMDGKQINISDGVFAAPHIETGTHFVQFRLTDYKTIRDSFTVYSRQQCVRDYVLEPIPLGVATIQTDQGIGIYRYDREDSTHTPIYLGHTSFTGKIPAGDNTIELRNTEGIACQYHLFLNDKEVRDAVTMPYIRKLMVRTNITGGKVVLKNDRYRYLPIKANKKLKMNPMKYEIEVTKRGYETFRDSIDLSIPDVKNTIFRANLHRPGDSLHTFHSSPAFLQRYYDNAGTWFIGIIDFGYTFDLNGSLTNETFKHIVNFGLLPIRYRMLGINPLDFEVSVADNDSLVGGESKFKGFYYRPKLSLVVPAGKGFAFTFYGGLMFNLYDAFFAKPEFKPEKVRTNLIGGASMKFNSSGRFVMDLFAEYRHPLKGIEKDRIADGSLDVNKAQMFRVGVTFSAGVDH